MSTPRKNSKISRVDPAAKKNRSRKLKIRASLASRSNFDTLVVPRILATDIPRDNEGLTSGPFHFDSGEVCFNDGEDEECMNKGKVSSSEISSEKCLPKAIYKPSCGEGSDWVSVGCEGEFLKNVDEERPEPVSVSLLCRLSGLPNCCKDEEGALQTVSKLTIVVDTREQPCDEIGHLLPALKMLQLRNSSLASIRDLGTSLGCLCVLRASRCGLRELDGLSALPLLEELYVAFNDIWDLSSVALHENLQVLDLESNAVDETMQVAQLATCPVLWSLTLEGNPLLCRCASRIEYRRIVCQHIPSLVYLDDDSVNGADQQPCDSPDVAKLYRSTSLSSSSLAFVNEVSPNRTQNMADVAKNFYPLSSGSAPFLTFNRSLLDDKESQLVSASIKRFRPHGDGLTRVDSVNQKPSHLFTHHLPHAIATNEGSSSSQNSKLCCADVPMMRPSQRSLKKTAGDAVDSDGGAGSSYEASRVVTRGSSTLTHGDDAVVLAGNVTRGLRSLRLRVEGVDEDDAGETEILQELRAVKIWYASSARRDVGMRKPVVKVAERADNRKEEDDHEGDIGTYIVHHHYHRNSDDDTIVVDTDDQIPPSQAHPHVRLAHDNNDDDDDERVAIALLKKRAVTYGPKSTSLCSRPSSSHSFETSSQCRLNSSLSASEILRRDFADVPRDKLIHPLDDVEVRGLWRRASPTSQDLVGGDRNGHCQPSRVVGAANGMDERDIVELLRLRPKDVPELRTRTDFQRFFHGMEQAKLSRLLHEAYSHLDHETSSEKIRKRLGLFRKIDESPVYE